MSSTQEVGEIFGDGSGPAQAMLRSPTVIIASIGLWGMNVYFFRLFGIDYVQVLNLDLIKEKESKLLAESGEDSVVKHPDTPSSQDDDDKSLGKNSDVDGDEHHLAAANHLSTVPFGNRITWVKLVYLSFFLLFLLHLSEYVWVEMWEGGSIGAVFLFYGTVVCGVLFPLASTQWVRTATVLVLQRTYELVNPRCSCIHMPARGPRPIPFIDVFYADAMCSLSKVFFDWGMLFHLASHYPHPVPKSTHSILIPSFCAAIPYIIRARQCLIMYTVGKIKHDPKRYLHILNAIKYSTSIFPLCLSAYQQTTSASRAAGLEGFLITLLIINALYALAWDIIMDWGMMQNPAAVVEHTLACGVPSEEARGQNKSCGHAVLRKRLRFGVLASAGILIADSILRFSWLLRFQESLFPSKDHFVLITQFLEVFRRAIWNLLRVEWEHIKQNRAPAASVIDNDEEVVQFVKNPVIHDRSS